MNEIIKKQLDKFDKDSYNIIDDTKIVFNKKASVENEVKVIFENYFITGFDGFDFHDKFNNGIAPFSKVMYGTVIKETDKMYKFKLHSESDNKVWEGYCPKKSCAVIGG